MRWSSQRRGCHKLAASHKSQGHSAVSCHKYHLFPPLLSFSVPRLALNVVVVQGGGLPSVRVAPATREYHSLLCGTTASRVLLTVLL